jgi:PAS domain-containing protein
MNTTHLNYETLALRENPDAAILTSLEGEVLHWGNGAERVFGYSSSEAVGRTVNELLVPSNRLDEEDFQAFTQIDAGPTRLFEGTGLGLHLSQKLASLLGARITCESELDRGSRFTLHLPLAS